MKLEKLYEDMKLYKSLYNVTTKEEQLDKLTKRMVRLKQEIRQLQKRPIDPVRRYFSDSDYCVEFFEADKDSDLEEIRETTRIDLPYSDYDCTGRPFTIGIRIARKPDGAYLVRHSIGRDV